MQQIWGKETYNSLSEILAPAHTALVVVDMQNDFCDIAGHDGQRGLDLTATARAVAQMGAVVDAARAAGILVVWVQQTLLPQAKADSPAWLRRRTHGGHDWDPAWTIDGTWGQEIVMPLQPAPGEPKVKKCRSSAFVDTTLDLILRSNEIESIAMGGVVTQGCVESSARHATFLDYYLVLLEDCVANTNDEIHAASMVCQRTRYDFALSEAVIAAWDAPASHGLEPLESPESASQIGLGIEALAEWSPRNATK